MNRIYHKASLNNTPGFNFSLTYDVPALNLAGFFYCLSSDFLYIVIHCITALAVLKMLIADTMLQ